jgi:FKBP-type peptidyl-prolyl cis-trans isomerase
MAQNAQRVFIIVIVAVFLVSALGFTGIVIWSLTRDDPELTSEIDQVSESEQLNQEGDMLAGSQLEGFEPIAGAVTELQTIDIEEGSGQEVQPGATVVAHYTGAVAETGTIFQSSLDGGQPIPFSLNEVISGWTEGVPGMKVGGTRRLIIPSDKAYGANPPPGSNIPPNAALVFDIELVEIEQ